jgi:hypothetical protein
MAGPKAPPYLQASCLSIAGSADRFDMLIFHEDNAAIINMSCADNVKKINVHKHGLARLITAAICQAPQYIATVQQLPPGSKATVTEHGNDTMVGKDRSRCVIKLGEALQSVLHALPYFLCEYKIGVRA